MVTIWKGPVYLEPIEHVYIHRVTGQKYTSVTKVLSSIEPHFDADGIAASIFKQKDDKKNPVYVGMSVQQILNYWQELNDNANEYGTHVHETIEKYLMKSKIYFPTDELEKKIIKGYNELKVDEGQTIYPERIMFSEEHALAGTADLIIDIDETYFDVGDWKTNRAFNFFSEFKSRMLKPFDHLDNCQYTVYTLQLSTYAYMYELETGRKCRQIWIGYWDKIAQTLTKIPVFFARAEAKKLLDMHKYNSLA